MATILEKIVATKREEIASAKSACPEAELRKAVADAPPVRDFFSALAPRGGRSTVSDTTAGDSPIRTEPIRLIAEVKKASPSKGLIREDFQPVEIARIYQQHGAACISVLTDRPYFQGDLQYLRDIRQHVQIPLLRKDFILDEYQLLEARVAGADSVLLIAECLTDLELRRLHDGSLELGMTPLVEIYEPDNLPRVLDVGAKLIGVNNRDLRTFEVDLQHTIRMRRRVPEECVLVGESGIHGRDDALVLQAAGVHAILVGEHLMANADIGAAVDCLLGRA
jgi:indole-3-glycerol phosphate synthase